MRFDNMNIKQLCEAINSASISTDEAIAGVKAMGSDPQVIAHIEEITAILETRIRQDATKDKQSFLGARLRLQSALSVLANNLLGRATDDE